MTRQRHEPERREHCGQREQQRDPGRDERSECDHEDDQRDRDGEDAGALQVVAECGVDPVRRARIAELADEEVRMGALRRGDAVEHRLDLVGRLVLVALDLEFDERGVPAARDLTGVAGFER